MRKVVRAVVLAPLVYAGCAYVVHWWYGMPMHELVYEAAFLTLVVLPVVLAIFDTPRRRRQAAEKKDE
jgi:uncharacterized membrane protein